MPLLLPKVGDPNVVQSVTTRLTSDSTTTSTTYAVLLSLPITTVGSTNLLIWLSYCMSFTPSVSNDFRMQLRIDTAVILYAGEEEFTTAQSGAIVHRATGLSAAAHTVDLRWRIGAAGEGTLRCRPSVSPEGLSIFAMEVRV